MAQGWGSASRWSLVELGRKPENTKLVCRTLPLCSLAAKQARKCHIINMAVAVGAVAVGAVGAVGAAVAVGMLWVARG